MRRFIVAGTPRSGSTWLQTLLKQMPGVFCTGELLDLPNLKSGGWKRPWPALKKYWEQHAKSRACGFRFFYHSLTMFPQILEAWENIKSDKTIHIIHFSRENLLELVTSWEIAWKDKVWKVTSDKRQNKIKLNLEPEFYKNKFEEIEAGLERLRSDLSDHPTLSLTYEELVVEREKSLHSICNFLGADFNPNARSAHRKKEKRPLPEIHENYKELREYFSDTKYSKWFIE